MSKEGWQMVRFGDVVRQVTETEQNPLSKGITRYVGLADLDPDSIQLKRWGEIAEDDTTFTRLFRKGQMLFGRRRAYQRKAALAPFDGICSGDIIVMEAKPQKLLPELLPFLIHTDGFFEYAMRTSAGSLSPRTKWSHLAKYEFALPPLAEQRRIAEILTAVEENIRQHENLQEALDLELRVLRVHLFGKENGNIIYKLADLCNNGKGIQIGPFGSQLHAYDYVEEGVPVVMPSNMDSDEVLANEIVRITPQMANKLSRHKVKVGDILLPRRGELDRRAYVHPAQEGWICGTGSIRIRIQDKAISRAIFHALSARHTVTWLERFAVGTTMPNLNTTIISNVPVYLPNKREAIETAVNQLEQILETQKAVEQKISATQKLKRAVLREMLS